MNVNKRKIWKKLNLDKLLNERLENISSWEILNTKTKGLRSEIDRYNFLDIIVFPSHLEIELNQLVKSYSLNETLARKVVFWNIPLQRRIRKIWIKFEDEERYKEEKILLEKIPKNILRDNTLDELLHD